MAGNNESDQERSLPASERRLADAREQGRLPRSRALAHLAVIGAVAVVVWLAGEPLIDRYVAFLAAALRFDDRVVFDGLAVGVRSGELILQALLLTLPVLFTVALAGAAAAVALGGWNFTLKPLELKLDNLDPASGFGRIFSARSVVDVLKVSVEALLLVAVVGLFLWKSMPQLAGLPMIAQDSGISSLVQLLVAAAITITMALAVTAVIDVPLQLWRHAQSLRMTLDEARREARESDGDPYLRQRIRSTQREMARRRMMEEVPKADVVVTNPTHYAVALAYREASDSAPRVVAKGADLIAGRIRELAAANRVPVLESPALARALFRHAEVGDPIPRPLYEAVAQVLAYVFRLRSAVAGLRDEAFEPVAVPPGMDPFGATQ